MSACIPGEEIEIGEIELGRQVAHAARVLVAAVKEHDRPACRLRGRPPAAIEQPDAVVGCERVLGRRGDYDIRLEYRDRERAIVHRLVLDAAAAPPLTRLTMLQPISRAISGIAQKNAGGSGPPTPTQSPSAPKASARS